ncbi:MAG: hypothetical protein ACJ786_36990 [Catenulispora sp.]
MNAATAVTVIGGLITASGAGVYIRTKWFSNFPDQQRPPELRFSWVTVAVGLIVLAVGVLIIVLQKGIPEPGGGGGQDGGGGGAAVFSFRPRAEG